MHLWRIGMVSTFCHSLGHFRQAWHAWFQRLKTSVELTSILSLQTIDQYSRDHNIPSSLKVLAMKTITFWRCPKNCLLHWCLWSSCLCMASALSDHNRRINEEGGSCLFVHQWLMIHHFGDVKVSKNKFTNSSKILLEASIHPAKDEVKFNDSPKNTAS